MDVESDDEGPSEAKRRKVDDEEEKENGAKKSKFHAVPDMTRKPQIGFDLNYATSKLGDLLTSDFFFCMPLS